MKKHVQKGFTLYELLITMLIIALILTIGVPNLSDFTRNSRVTGLTNDLHGSFFLARSEAARAKENVTICASGNPFDPEPTCGGGATFADGWIIFLDRNGDADRAVGGDENVLKAFPAVDDSIHINTNGPDRFSFEPTGLGTASGPFIATICDDRGNVVAAGGESAARRIVVTPIGRSTIIRDQQTIANSGVAC